MGGGGGGAFSSTKPEDLARLVRKAEDETTVAAFEAVGFAWQPAWDS